MVKRKSEAVASRSRKRIGKVRKRLQPEARKAQILDAAAKLIVEQGYLPPSIEALAQRANSSKALVYAYFATQYELLNALLKREIDELITAGADAASRVDDLDQAALLCAMLYFERVAQTGPLLHILLTDLYMHGHTDRGAVRAGNAMLQRLVGLAQASLKLPKKEVIAAIVMIATIPEEAGTLTHQRDLDITAARQLCHSLMLSSLQALRSPGRVKVSPDYVS